MATASTVTIEQGSHTPDEEHIKVFKLIESDLKKDLLHKRHTYPKHEKEYFEAVSHLSDSDLVAFTSTDLEQVRIANSDYGYHMFGMVRIPAMPDTGPAYIMFRAFMHPSKFHSIHTEEKEAPDGGKKFRAIFNKDDSLVFFQT